MEGNMRGPSSADCIKSDVRMGSHIPQQASNLVQISL
jgi:hypothetical protein